jgi:hypothetical protein
MTLAIGGPAAKRNFLLPSPLEQARSAQPSSSILRRNRAGRFEWLPYLEAWW